MGLIIDKISGNPLLIDIKESDLDASLIAKINSNKNTIPAQDIAMQYFDGTRVGNEFVDKGIQGLNLDIIDNDIELTSGFPYKSAAKIKQKATSFGLIPNPNLFWFQADGTPNEIPVVSLFQNIDYANQIFTRHIDQVIDGNGVETYEPRVLDIVTYASALTGDNLTLANAYYKVPVEVTTAVKWVDTVNGLDTNAGTKLLPWKTLVKANATATANDTIYVKSGIYAENYAGVGYLNISNALNFKSIGLVKITATLQNRIIKLSDVNCSFDRIIFDGGNFNVFCVEAIATHTKTDIFTSCLFKGFTNSALKCGIVGENTLIKNCVIVGALVATRETQDVNISTTVLDTNYFKNVRVLLTNTDVIVKNNLFKDCEKESCIKLTAIALDCFGNEFNYQTSAILLSSVYSTEKDININNNQFNQLTAIGFNNFSISITGTINSNIKNNNFYTESIFTGTSYFIYSRPTNGYVNEIDSNIFESTSISALTHIFAIGQETKIRNNYLKSNSLTGTTLSLGSEALTDGLTDNSVITGNTIIGFKINNPTGVSSTHSLFVNNGINTIIAYNKVAYSCLGIVVKAGSGLSYTSGGVYYNLVENCQRGIWVRGITGLNIFNNTIKHNAVVYINNFLYAIYCDENSAGAGNQFSENIISKNNILDIQLSTGILIGLDAHAAANGCIAEYNTLNGGQYLLDDGTNYSSLAVAQSAGKLLNCTMLNPNLDADLIPASKIEYAVDLGTDYDDGLDVTSDFESETVSPVIVTKQQAATWQNGAYIL